MALLERVAFPVMLDESKGDVRQGDDMKQLENRLDDIEELFDRADENHDDQVTLKEFRGLMLELDGHMLDNTVLTNFLQMDANGDGHIGFGEFRSWWINY